MLDNITINQTDLEAVKKDIVSRYLTDNDSYVTAVDAIKKDVYGELKAKLRNSYPSYSNAELDTLMEDVKDLPNEENLTRRIATLSVAKILEYNDLLSEAAYYRQLANGIPLTYYIDTDESDTVESTEEATHSSVVLGR